MASNRADDQEISMLALHLLQLSLVYINTLMIQQVLAAGSASSSTTAASTSTKSLLNVVLHDRLPEQNAEKPHF